MASWKAIVGRLSREYASTRIDPQDWSALPAELRKSIVREMRRGEVVGAYLCNVQDSIGNRCGLEVEEEFVVEFARVRAERFGLDRDPVERVEDELEAERDELEAEAYYR